MAHDADALADFVFRAAVIHWRGPSPFHFVALPEEQVGEVRYAARTASYGWGVVPVAATVKGVDFSTSLFPKDGGYLLPLKDAVRKAGAIALGDVVDIRLQIRNRRLPDRPV